MSTAIKPTTRRAILPEPGKPLIVDEVPTPEPKENQVLIKVAASPVAPADYLWSMGWYPTGTLVGGLECSGIVVKSGGGAKADALVGKAVASLNHTGNWAEYVVSDLKDTFELAPGSDLKQLACNYNPLTVLGMVNLVKKGNHKAVLNTAGSTSIGRLLAQTLEVEGIKNIQIVRKQDQVEKFSKLYPSATFLNSTAPDFVAQLTKVTADLGATIAFDAIGGALVGQVFNALPPGSQLYLYGSLSGEPANGFAASEVIFKKKEVKGYSVYFVLEDPAFAAEVPKLLYNRPAHFNGEIQKEFPLSQANEAIQYTLKNGSDGRVLINPSL